MSATGGGRDRMENIWSQIINWMDMVDWTDPGAADRTVQKVNDEGVDKFIDPELSASANYEILKDRFNLETGSDRQTARLDIPRQVEQAATSEIERQIEEYGIRNVVDAIHEKNQPADLQNRVDDVLAEFPPELYEGPLIDAMGEMLQTLGGDYEIVSVSQIERLREQATQATAQQSSAEAIAQAEQQLTNQLSRQFGMQFGSIEDAVQRLKDRVDQLRGLKPRTGEITMRARRQAATPLISVEAGFTPFEADIREQAARAFDLEATNDALGPSGSLRAGSFRVLGDETIQQIDLTPAGNDQRTTVSDPDELFVTFETGVDIPATEPETDPTPSPPPTEAVDDPQSPDEIADFLIQDNGEPGPFITRLEQLSADQLEQLLGGLQTGAVDSNRRNAIATAIEDMTTTQRGRAAEAAERDFRTFFAEIEAELGFDPTPPPDTPPVDMGDVEIITDEDVGPEDPVFTDRDAVDSARSIIDAQNDPDRLAEIAAALRDRRAGPGIPQGIVDQIQRPERDALADRAEQRAADIRDPSDLIGEAEPDRDDRSRSGGGQSRRSARDVLDDARSRDPARDDDTPDIVILKDYMDGTEHAVDQAYRSKWINLARDFGWGRDFDLYPEPDDYWPLKPEHKSEFYDFKPAEFVGYLLRSGKTTEDQLRSRYGFSDDEIPTVDDTGITGAGGFVTGDINDDSASDDDDDDDDREPSMFDMFD